MYDDLNFEDIQILEGAEDLPLLNYEQLRDNHLLIGGASGSGKSTVLHKFIAELLKDTVKETLLILCDPKIIELDHYRKDKHCIKYGNDSRSINRCLDLAIDFMMFRYKDMRKRGLTLWDGSHIYLIIDEVADLLLTDRKQIEPKLQRLLQLGRASCVHVVICTQSPSRKTIPSYIQVNCVNRLALYCDNKIESKQIIGINGAECLPFHGEGILKTPQKLQHIKIEL